MLNLHSFYALQSHVNDVYNSTERSALTETVVDVAGQIAAQRSSGKFTAQVNFVIPDVIIQRIRVNQFCFSESQGKIVLKLPS